MVCNVDEAIFEQLPICLHFFPAVDMQTMTQPHHQRKHSKLADMQQNTLTFEPEALLMIGIVFIQNHIPKVLDIDHVRIAFFRVTVVQIVSIIHKIPPHFTFFATFLNLDCTIALPHTQAKCTQI